MFFLCNCGIFRFVLLRFVLFRFVSFDGVSFRVVSSRKQTKKCSLLQAEYSDETGRQFASIRSICFIRFLLVDFFFCFVLFVLFCSVLFCLSSVRLNTFPCVLFPLAKKNKFPRACCCSMSAKPVTCRALKLPNWGKKNWCKNCRGKKKADKCERRAEWLNSQQVVQMAKPQPKRMHRKAIVETEDQVQESSHGCASWTPHAYMRKRCPQYKLLNTDKESWLRTLHKRRRLMWRPLHNSSQPETPAQPETSAQPDAPPPRPQPEASASASMDK